jgi:hypothetical protein
MKLFHFYRREDHSGVSGTGPVVEGVQFTNGWCALRWISNNSSLCFYQSLEDVRKVHSHGGKTEVVVHDFDPPKSRRPAVHAEFDLFMEIIDEVSRLVNCGDDASASAVTIHRDVARVKAMLDELGRSLTRKIAA